MAESDDIEPVTEADVRAAEREAEEAERFAQSLVEKVAAGDDDITPDEIEAQEKVSRFARLRASGVRARAERYRAAARLQKIRDLRDEVIATAPQSGDDLVKALKAVEKAARKFTELAEAHDQRLVDWVKRVQALRINTGTSEHGVGLNGINQLVVNGVTFDLVHGALRLGGVFQNQQSGFAVPMPVRPEGDDSLVATYRELDKIGEGL